MKRAVYAGSFDPITYGHIDIFNKANNLFDEITIIVANNPNKKYLFTADERINLVKLSTNANVILLPDGELTAYLACTLGITHLVRGLRGHIDVDDEFVSARLNKEIGNLETVFFVPDINIEELSSSVVRGIYGLRGWVEILSNKVPPCVIRALKIYDLERKVNNEKLWKIVKKIESRSYHNLEHCYDIVYDMIYNLDKDFVYDVILASVIHDLEDNPKNSLFSIYNKDIEISDFVKELVLATDHSKEYPVNDLCLRFISSDLKILASKWDKYENYCNNVRKEYSDLSEKEWIKGRSDFLKMMLNKDIIYPHQEYEKLYGDISRYNMKRELENLIKRSNCNVY